MKTHDSSTFAALQEYTKNLQSREGFVLPMVLVVTVFALMLGFGRLVLFRAQTRMRIDRQRDLHHMLATRSAMRWLETRGKNPLPAEMQRFSYSVSDGKLGVSLCPVVPIFPVPGNSGHFNPLTCSGANSLGDFNYITHSDDNNSLKTIKPILQNIGDGEMEIVLGDDHAPTGFVGRLAIDVPAAETLWTDDVYGRRYGMTINEVRKGGVKDGENYPGDLIKLYITPEGVPVGTADWMIWLERDQDAGEIIPVSLCYQNPSGIKTVCETEMMNFVGKNGIQISGRQAVLFNQKPVGDVLATHTYDVHELPLELVNYFKEYPYGADGPGVRLTLEVEIRCPNLDADTVLKNTFGVIKVEPAYEYYTELDWSNDSGLTTSEVSTVIRYDPNLRNDDNKTEKAITYDTHGTAARRR